MGARSFRLTATGAVCREGPSEQVQAVPSFGPDLLHPVLAEGSWVGGLYRLVMPSAASCERVAQSKLMQSVTILPEVSARESPDAIYAGLLDV